MTDLHEWQLSQVRVECGGCHMFAWCSETIEGADGMRYHPEHLPVEFTQAGPAFRSVSRDETFAIPMELLFDLECAG